MVADRTAGTIDLLYDLDIDVTLNAPVVVFAVPLPEGIHLRRARIRGDVIVRDGPLAEGFVCSSRTSCTPDLRSGLRVTVQGGAGAPRGSSALVTRTPWHRDQDVDLDAGDPAFPSARPGA
jgi:hypothetical protein